jgi:molybdate transport system substrate-binding protein
MPRNAFFLALACGAVFSSAARAGEVQVAVAANFAGPMARIGEAFTAATGHTVKLSSGATGKLYAQIVAGAPFELLVAADDETPRKLVAEGHAVAGSSFTYAIGKLVLWSARPGFVDDQGAVLGKGGFAHLAIANPKLAPYGAAGMAVLKARGLASAVAPKLVTAESIAQAYQFVATGNAELGFVALSQVIAAGTPPGDQRPLGGPAPAAPRGSASAPGQQVKGSYWLVPPSFYGEIRQDAVLLKAGEKNPAAAALLAYLKSDAAKATIQSYGYGLK